MTDETILTSPERDLKPPKKLQEPRRATPYTGKYQVLSGEKLEQLNRDLDRGWQFGPAPTRSTKKRRRDNENR